VLQRLGQVGLGWLVGWLVGWLDFKGTVLDRALLFCTKGHLKLRMQPL